MQNKRGRPKKISTDIEDQDFMLYPNNEDTKEVLDDVRYSFDNGKGFLDDEWTGFETYR